LWAGGGPLHALRKPDQRGDSLDVLREVVESLPHRVEEVPAKDQILRRVSREAELGQDG
jgi:hypothetical protein